MNAATIVAWWCFLCAVGALNLLVWSLAAAELPQRRGALSAQEYAACRRQLALSAVYVFGCAFRCALPVCDVPRICLVNSWVSSVIVGRSVATFAELCFVGQWALMLRETARDAASSFAIHVSRALVPLIAIAESCSWYSVLTTSNLGHVAEESIWAGCAALLVLSMLLLRARCAHRNRTALMVWGLAGMIYVLYMLLIDVPMYWGRWLADEAGRRRYLSLAQGVFDAAGRRMVSFRWQDWRHEIAWMSLYFSVAVWISISLIHAPLRTTRTLASRSRVAARVLSAGAG